MLKIFTLAVFFIFTLTYLIFKVLFREKEVLEERLKKYTTSRRERQKRDEDVLNLPFTERVVKPLVSRVSGVISRLTPARSQQKLQSLLQLAGNPGNLKAAEFQAILYLLMLLAMIVVGFLSWLGHKNLFSQVFLVATAALFVNLLGKVYLNSRIRARKAAMQKALPDALDLLTVSVEAGLGFDAALLHVVSKSKGPLAGEFLVTLKEMQMGKTRRDALRDLGKRTELEDLLNFVGAMIQADQLGVSISKILRTQADQMRMKRRQRVEEQAMKAPVKMLIPLVFFIFPSIFIVLLGPAAMRIYEVLVKGR